MEVNDKLHDIASLLYSGLTVPLLVFCGLVVCIWWRDALGAFLKKSKLRTSADWFIIGVCAGFVGKAVDAFYWSIPWSLGFIESPAEHVFHDLGVFPNIPFRMVLGTFAAYCHCRSYVQHSRERGADTWVSQNLLNNIFLVTSVLGVMFSGFLCWLKWGQ